MTQRFYSDFIDSYVDYTQGQEASERVHRWVALSILAASLERKVYIDRGYYPLFPNLYTFIIGPSGVVRKSTSTRIGVDLLRGLDNINVMSERMTAASLIMQLERSNHKYTQDGEEKQQSAIFAYASELAVFLGEVYGSTAELLTDFYDCSPHDCSKPWTYENKSEGKISIYGPCLNILGASTPTWLRNCIPVDQMEGGLASRILFVVETEPKRFIAWPELKPELRDMKPKLESDLAHIHNLSGKITVSPEAHQWFEEWYCTHQKGIVTTGDLKFAGYFGRKGETLLKIAICCSVSESSELRLEIPHLERAMRFLEGAELNMFEAFGNVGKEDYSTELCDIWKLIRDKGTIAHSEILRRYHKDLNHKSLIDIMQTLQNMSVIKSPQMVSGRLVYAHNPESDRPQSEA